HCDRVHVRWPQRHRDTEKRGSRCARVVKTERFDGEGLRRRPIERPQRIALTSRLVISIRFVKRDPLRPFTPLRGVAVESNSSVASAPLWFAFSGGQI